MRDYESLPGYDAWISREPEYAEEPLPEEDELPPEPTVEEVWDGAHCEYIQRATFPSGNVFVIMRTTEGRFIWDYEILGAKGIVAEGFHSQAKAIEWLLDPERRDW